MVEYPHVPRYLGPNPEYSGKLLVRSLVTSSFVPTKAQNKEYMRVRVRFDVTKHLRRFKVVNFPTEQAVTIWYDFERIKKMCYE